MKTTQAILIEALLVMESSLCWIVALPAAALLLAGFAVWEKLAARMPRTPIGPTPTGMSPVSA
jgi:hypothetical protein